MGASPIPQRRAAFRDAATTLRHRIESLVNLEMEGLDALALSSKLKEIGSSSASD